MENANQSPDLGQLINQTIEETAKKAALEAVAQYQHTTDTSAESTESTQLEPHENTVSPSLVVEMQQAATGSPAAAANSTDEPVELSLEESIMLLQSAADKATLTDESDQTPPAQEKGMAKFKRLMGKSGPLTSDLSADKSDADHPLDKKLKKQLARDMKRARKKMAKANKKKKLPATTQGTIPYKEMLKDGLCQVDKNTWSISIKYFDINYQLAKTEDKEAIFEQYCNFLNLFDSSISLQLSFVNHATQTIDAEASLKMPDQEDGYNQYRHEMNEILLRQVTAGKKVIQKDKYITLTVQADNKDSAIQKLSRIEAEAKNALKSLGCRIESLDGYDRLKLLHDTMNNNQAFRFAWDLIAKTGLTSKDFIAPDSFDFRPSRHFLVNDRYAAVSYLDITASELPDDILSRLLDMENDQIITIHVQSIDQNTAIKQVKRKVAGLEKNKIEEQKKAIKNGYDMDILPPDLITYINEAKDLLDDLQSRNERMFNVTFVVVNFADDLDTLKNDLFQIDSIAQSVNCRIRRLDYQQEDGFVSSLPLGVNRLKVSRMLTTSPTAIFVPFTTQELYHPGGMYYGLNALSSNLIICNRKDLKNPNGLILGTPGSGKSFSAKREIVNVFLTTNDDIIIIDPEDEYGALVEALGGQVIEISQNSPHYINPLEIQLESDEDNPIMDKADFVLSLCELLFGGKRGLSPIEHTIIDRSVRLIYNKYVNDPQNTPMPTMADLYQVITEQPEQEARNIAIALELYVQGSLNIFNHQTNVDTTGRITCFNIKNLGNALKKMGMLIIQEYVWSRVSLNRTQNKKTWYYVDEFHLLLKEPQTAAYSIEIWKRFRKYGGVPTGITQNVKDLLGSREIENILENSDFIYMLNQAPGDRKELAQRLGISEQQLSHVTNTPQGHGLIFFGNVIIPFADKFPRHTALYSLMTTKPEEVAARFQSTHLTM